MDDQDGTIANYLAACDDLSAAVRGMTRQQLNARPQPDKWSTMQVLCHLVDMDLFTAYRIRVALVSDRPRLPGTTREQITNVLLPEARRKGVVDGKTVAISALFASAPGSLDGPILVVPTGILSQIGPFRV